MAAAGAAAALAEAAAGMRILDRYLLAVLLRSTLAALGVLLAVDLFFAFINEVQDLGQGHYRLADALLYLALTLPDRAYAMFPMAALLGGLLGLGGMAAASELVAMRAAGISILRIGLSVLLAGAVMLLVMMPLGEGVAPVADEYAQWHKAMAKSQHISFRSRGGLWVRDGNRFIHFREIRPDGSVGGVRVFELDADFHLVRTLTAASARYEGGRWILRDVHEGRALPDGGWRLARQDRRRLGALLAPEFLSLVNVRPEHLSLRELHRYLGYLHRNALDARAFELAYWHRLLQPLAVLVMLWVALPFVFGPLRRSGTGQRLLVGVLVGILFYLLNQMMGHFGQIYGLRAYASALLPSLLFFVLAGLALRRQR